MLKKRVEFLKGLFSLRNIFPILIIIAAFIGTFVENPFGLERNQLILGLLAFILIDGLLERLDLLTKIEKDVHILNDLIKSRIAGRDFLKHRKDFPRLEKMIYESKKEIWISGVTLDTMVSLTATFNEKLKDGTKLRFLSINFEKNIMEDSSKYFCIDKDELAGRINANLTTIYKRIVQKYPEQVEIRTFNHRPAIGYFIVDPEDEQGYMIISFYLYNNLGRDVFPTIFLSKKIDQQWFDIYLEDFKVLWANSTEWRNEF